MRANKLIRKIIIAEEKTTAKKSKRIVRKGSDYELVGQIRGSANQIWFAGLGAFSDAQARGGKLFDGLVKQGEVIQKRAAKAAEEIIAEVKPGTQRVFGRRSGKLDARATRQALAQQ
jgi:polyhydroxyalkanoate synthesis regulator phasin